MPEGGVPKGDRKPDFVRYGISISRGLENEWNLKSIHFDSLLTRVLSLSPCLAFFSFLEFEILFQPCKFPFLFIFVVFFLFHFILSSREKIKSKVFFLLLSGVHNSRSSGDECRVTPWKNGRVSSTNKSRGLATARQRTDGWLRYKLLLFG